MDDARPLSTPATTSARSDAAPAPGPTEVALGEPMLNDDATFTVEVARDPAELAPRTEAWEALGERAIEPNPFYEPWMLLPSLRMLDREQSGLEVVLVLRRAQPEAPEELVGLFPLVRRARFRGTPVAYLSSLHHHYCPDTTPLIDRRYARGCMAAFLGWLAARREPVLLELPRVVADGAAHHLLADVLDPRQFIVFPDEDSTRAILRKRSGDADAYLSDVLGGHGRKRLRSKERHLRGLGKLEAHTLGEGDDVDAWMDEFLALEAAGWKGREGTAIAARDADTQFFRDVVSAAFRRGRLLGQSLRLDGRPIAMKCSFIAGEGAFAWKIAFDESSARDSPGILLEVEAIRELYARPGLQWLDSCAASESRMFRELYGDRREMRSLLIARLDGLGGLLVALVPLRRWVRGAAKRAAASVRAVLTS